jgi:hypothetical protein
MKKIVAIGGAVIKTGASESLKNLLDDIEILIHNGGSLFHDFQLAINGFTGVPIVTLQKDIEINREASEYLGNWIKGDIKAPKGSLTGLCENKGIPVLMFTGMGCDYWQLFVKDWKDIAESCQLDFNQLRDRFRDRDFHYLCMGSAVIHPEVFLKAIQNLPESISFRADVVDFKDMYRPKTRIAQYGNYYLLEHNEFCKMWLRGEYK